MPQVTFTEDSYSDVISINRAINEGYTKLDVRADNDDLTAEVYVDNLTDKGVKLIILLSLTEREMLT